MDQPSVTIAARGLCKSFNGTRAVNAIDFEVRAGECFGFLGPNGAGKTTTMKMVCGLASVGGGELLVLGRDISQYPRAVKAKLGVVPQADNLDPDLNTRENLLAQADYHGLDRRTASERADELLEFAKLADRRSSPVRDLSGGMRRALLVARALVPSPEIVILDEPTTGLDPHARNAIWRTLRALRDGGVTLLLTTHYMEEAMSLCDRIAIMHSGRIVDRGTPQQLMLRYGQPDLEAVFLHLTGDSLDVS